MCEVCNKRQADRKVIYGLYSAHRAGRPHHTLALCSVCSKDLWDGGSSAPLKNLVTAGLAHFEIEPLTE